MKIPVVSKALNSAKGCYTPDDYSVLQLMAEVGESDSTNSIAVGAYALFQMYTGSLGYWTYEGNSPFMGLQNLPHLIEFTKAFGWPELENELQSISSSLEKYSPEQLQQYASFTLESGLHEEIDAITFPVSITELIRADAAAADDDTKFRKACLYLESTVEFLEFEDRAALRTWQSSQE
jgi:hypothetical protein